MQTFIDFGEIIPAYFGPNGLLSARDTEVPKDEKGLKNYMGENNCFLNVVIQSLWHLEPFRLKFRHPKVQAAHMKISPHPENCVFCSLEVIFTQYEFSEDREVPPTALRQTMAVLYKAQQKFQLFEIDDAAEAFEAVVGGIHDELSSKESVLPGKSCTSKYCVPHRVFGINAVDQVKCNKCGAESEPIKTTLFSGYAYAAGLRAVYSKYPKATFCQLLSLSSADRRLCPNKEKCSNLCTIDHSITSLPEVFTVGVVWENADATLSEIETMLNMISWQIDLNNIFNLDVIKNPKLRKKSTLYKLRGMICYYGKHYTAYFYSFKNLQWFMFDDATVKPVGVDWVGIRERCLRGRVKPTMLFYETVDPADNLIESSIEFQHHPFSEAMESPVPVPSNEVPSKKELSESTLFIEPLGGVAVKKEVPKTVPKSDHVPFVTNPVHTANESKPIVNTVDATVQTDHSPRAPNPQLTPPVTPPKPEPPVLTPPNPEPTAPRPVTPPNPTIEAPKEVPKEAPSPPKAEVPPPVVTPAPEPVMVPPPVIPTPVTNGKEAPVPAVSPVNDSFVLLPSKDELDKEREFVVTRTNWLYRRQSRIFRFSEECFYRIIPETNTIKERFEYKDVLEVTTVDDTNMIIRFYSDKEPQYLTSPQVKEILAFLTKKAAVHNHKFRVKPAS